MLEWALSRLFQLVIRLLVTLAACLTLQHLIQAEGYRCELWTLAVGAACIIIVTRLWMPWSKDS